MVERVLKGADRVSAKLEEIANKLRGGSSVSVGFMSEAKYADGTPVAAVAFWNEFGVPDRDQPPRPFFRRMISKESPEWGRKLAGAVRFTDYDAHKALSIMGEDIQGTLKQSINTLVSPPLASSTIARKGFSKPLIDTSHMLNSITYKVDA